MIGMDNLICQKAWFLWAGQATPRHLVDALTVTLQLAEVAFHSLLSDQPNAFAAAFLRLFLPSDARELLTQITPLLNRSGAMTMIL